MDIAFVLILFYLLQRIFAANFMALNLSEITYSSHYDATNTGLVFKGTLELVDQMRKPYEI